MRVGGTTTVFSALRPFTGTLTGIFVSMGRLFSHLQWRSIKRDFSIWT